MTQPVKPVPLIWSPCSSASRSIRLAVAERDQFLCQRAIIVEMLVQSDDQRRPGRENAQNFVQRVRMDVAEAEDSDGDRCIVAAIGRVERRRVEIRCEQAAVEAGFARLRQHAGGEVATVNDAETRFP